MTSQMLPEIPVVPPLPPPPPPPLPRIILRAGTGSVSVTSGQSVAVAFTLTRLEATAAVSLNCTILLAQGVTATFSPPSLPASAAAQEFTLTLTAAPTAPSATAELEVTATSAGALPALAMLGLTVVSPFSFTPGAPIVPIGASGESTVSRAAATVMAAFGRATVPFNLQVLAGVSGTISFAVSGEPAGVTAQFTPVTLGAPPGPGYIAITLTLAAGAGVTPGTSTVSCDVMVSGAVRGVLTFPLGIVAPFVSAVSPAEGPVPVFLRAGTTVTITGGGFGPGTTVAFGADTPVAAVQVAGDGTALTVVVPPTAASGPLRVVSPAGTATGAPEFAVDNYRNTHGFSWINSDSFQSMVGGSYSEADATALFGASQTFISVFGVRFFNPLVDGFLALADAMLDAGGQCYGMSLGSLRFAAGQMGFGGLPLQPAGAEPGGPPGPDAWLLDGPQLGQGTDVSPTLATFVHQQHLAQLSQESINNWIGFHASVTSAAGLRGALQQAFTAGGASGLGAIICLNPSTSEGHAVVAYEVADTGGGAFDILVYNPNIPFEAAEDGDPGLRAGQAGQSVISVMGDGTWSFSEFGWTGGIFNITVVPWNAIPATPTLPWAELVAGVLLAAVIWLITGDAAVSQVSDGQGHLLLAGGQWNTDPATMLPGVRPLPTFGGLGRSLPPAFASTSAATLVHTITGSAGGTYDLRWIGNGISVTMTGVPTAPGSDDTVIVRAGGIDFTPALAKAITATITGISATSSLPRTASLTAQAAAGARASLSFDATAETFSYVNAGPPAGYTLELSTISASGQPVSMTTPAPPAGTGDVVTFNPDWSQLGAGQGIISIRTPAGTVTNVTM